MPPAPARFAIAHWNSRGLPALLLAPLAGVYAIGAAVDRLLYRLGIRSRRRLPVPVVVVGNFTVGGTGKTPLVIALVEALRAAGFMPGVVSRGYGGTESGVAPVSPAGNATRFGDEPVLISRRTGVPVWVGRRRAEAGLALLAAHPRVNVIVCDDGLQHHALARDVEIAVVDVRGLGNGLLLPAGPLRERPRTVDAVVRNGAPPARGEFGMTLGLARLYRLRQPEQSVAPADLAGLRLHAAAGIGAPDRFFAQLAGLGLEFVPHPFPDHHRFTPDDLRFSQCDCVLITEKDAVKCEGFERDDVVVAAVDARLDPALPALVIEKLRGLPTS